MDLRTYFQLFWIPTIASGALLVLLWSTGDLSARARLLFGTWFVGALAAQYLGPGASGLWIVGLALQATLAVTLALKVKLERF